MSKAIKWIRKPDGVLAWGPWRIYPASRPYHQYRYKLELSGSHARWFASLLLAKKHARIVTRLIAKAAK